MPLLTVVGPLALLLLPALFANDDFIPHRTPKFTVLNPVIRPDSALIIVAQNHVAVRPLPLNVEFAGQYFARAAQVHADDEGQLRWQFRLSTRELPDSLLHDGTYLFRAGFEGEPLSEPVPVIVHTRPPQLELTVTSLREGQGQLRLRGRTRSRLFPPHDTVFLQLILQQEQENLSVPLSLQPVAAEKIDETGFAFEATVLGLAQLYHQQQDHQPTLALLACDRAGNCTIFQKNCTDLAAAAVQFTVTESMKEAGEYSEIAATRLPEWVMAAASREELVTLDLRVEELAGGVYQLNWTELPDSLRLAHPATIILRNEQFLAITFGQQYLDAGEQAGTCPRYRVIQAGRAGLVCSSTSVQAPAATNGTSAALQVRSRQPAVPAAARYLPRNQEAISAVVVRHTPAIQHCYQRQLKLQPDLKGRVVVRFVITPEGSVRAAAILSSTLHNAAVEDCLLKRIKRWQDFGASDPAQGDMVFKQTYLFGEN